MWEITWLASNSWTKSSNKHRGLFKSTKSVYSLAMYVLHVTNELRVYFLFMAQKGVCFGWSLFLSYPYTTTTTNPPPSLPPLSKIIVRTLYCMKFARLGEVRLDWQVQACLQFDEDGYKSSHREPFLSFSEYHFSLSQSFSPTPQ